MDDQKTDDQIIKYLQTVEDKDLPIELASEKLKKEMNVEILDLREE